jgi:hypothetical protein
MTVYLPVDPDKLRADLTAGAVAAAQYESICADRDAWRERARDLEAQLRLALAQRDEARAIVDGLRDHSEMAEPATSVRRPYLAVVGDGA